MVAMRGVLSRAPGTDTTGLPTCVWPPPSFGSERDGSLLNKLVSGVLSMTKPTPNPPDTDPASPYESVDS
ncbi:hypothetical protein EMIT0P294_130159 [Pseudomonas sp. IT-P294]